MKQPLLAAVTLVLAGGAAIALAIRLGRPTDNTGD